MSEVFNQLRAVPNLPKGSGGPVAPTFESVTRGAYPLTWVVNFYFKAGNYRAAEGRYRDATKWNGDNGDAWRRLGEAAQKAKAPVLVLNLQPCAALDYEHTDTGEWLANCSVCCAPEIANAFARAGVRFRVVSGMLHEDAAAWGEIADWCRAAGVARATLSQFVGLEPGQIDLDVSSLLQSPPEEDVPALDPAKNPVALEQAAAVEETLARLRALERSYFPRFYLQGAAYARGSGAETNGKILGGFNGLAPTTQNYALGFTVTFPISDLPSIQARQAAQSANMRAQQARAAQIATDLRAQWNRAVAMLSGARRIVANTPIQVSAARTATQQATARYEAGLGTITEAAEAQRLAREWKPKGSNQK